MARTVRNPKLDSRSARSKLPARKSVFWTSLAPGRSLGYRKGAKGGIWIAKLVTGVDRKETRIGPADDVMEPDGVSILSFAQAQEKSRQWFQEQVIESGAVVGPYTVANAIHDYLEEYKARSGRSMADMRSRTGNFILPELGNTEVKELTSDRIRKWHRQLAKEKPRARSNKAKGKINYRDNSNDPDADRKRRHSANKVLTILKAALNNAWHEGKTASDDAWRRIKPFNGVDAPRVRYLSQEECVRLVNACEPSFRSLVRAALFTGCRYGELAAFVVSDFNPDSGTIHVRESKSGKARHVVLATEGIGFFERQVAGKTGSEPLFQRPDGKRWGTSHQTRPLKGSCEAAKIEPVIGFHILRHSYASRLAMKGVPMAVIAEQLGHADTRMTERHYAHLAPSYVADTVRAAFGELGIVEESNVTPLRRP